MNPIAWLWRLPTGYVDEAQEGERVSEGFLARVSAYGFGATALASAFTIVVLPTRILDVAPEASKNTYLGVLSFVGLLIAVLVQPIVGGVSDRITTRWGNRAPFIVGGAIASTPLIVASGVAPSYVLLFVFICLLQVFSNSALGPYQGLIKDLVPYHQRGAASGMKMLMEVGGAMTVTAVVGVLMGRYEDTDQFLWLWASVGMLASLFLFGALATGSAIKDAKPIPPSLQPVGPVAADTQVHPDYRWFLGSRFVLVLAAASLQTFILFFLEDVVGIVNPAGQLWKVVLAVGLMAVVTAYPAGVLTDRVGRKRVMVLAGGLAFAASLLLLTAETMDTVVAIGALVGVAVGMFLGASWAMATDLVSSRRTAQQLGYLNLATAGGAGLARLNGIWVDRLNSRGDELGYTVLLVVCGVLFLVGVSMILAIRTTNHPGEVAR